jgi:hypothetical protein
MRAVLIATGQSPDNAFLDDHVVAPLLPVADRPFVQHVVEYLVQQGVVDFDWVLCYRPEEVERFLGGGERWGARFCYHLVRDPSRPYRGLGARIPSQGRDVVLLGHADRLPAIRLGDTQDSWRAGSASDRTTQTDLPATSPTLYGWRQAEAEPLCWSGWALFPPQGWHCLGWDDVDEEGLFRRICAAEVTPGWVRVPHLLSVQNLGGLLAANAAVLQGQFPGLLANGRLPQPLRVARKARVHPSARVVPPVCLGEDCEVAADAKVGPYVTVGAGCVIDRGTSVTNTVIVPGTYVGEDLELHNAFVSPQGLFRALPGEELRHEENCPIASLPESGLARGAGRLLSMAAGCLLLLSATPVFLVVAPLLALWRRGKVVYLTRVVRVPLGPDPQAWPTFTLLSFSPQDPGEGTTLGPGHFFLRFLPALVNVARGDLRLVGLPPQTPAQLRHLGADWQVLYRHSKAGILSATLLACDSLSEDEAYATEAVNALTGGLVRDVGLFLRYLVAVVGGITCCLPFLRPTGPPRRGFFAPQGSAAPTPVPGAAGREQVDVTADCQRTSHHASVVHLAHPPPGPHLPVNRLALGPRGKELP